MQCFLNNAGDIYWYEMDTAVRPNIANSRRAYILIKAGARFTKYLTTILRSSYDNAR